MLTTRATRATGANISPLDMLVWPRRGTGSNRSRCPLRVDQIHSAFFHLHRQEILNRIFLLEKPLRECHVRRPALRPYIVQRVGPTEFQRDQVVQFADLTLARVI